MPQFSNLRNIIFTSIQESSALIRHYLRSLYRLDGLSENSTFENDGMNKDYTAEIKGYFTRVKEAIDRIDADDLNKVMNVLEKARDEGRYIFIMGNGGSAASASHFVCDFNKGISSAQEKKYRFVCLNDNVPTMMAIANDLSYAEVFIHQLRNFHRPGDVAIGISGSGNSANVVNALTYAKENGGTTIAFTGYDGGKLKRLADYNVHIPVNDMQISEDLHMVLNHCMMKILSNGAGC